MAGLQCKNSVLLRAELTPHFLWFNGNSFGQLVLLCQSPQMLRIRFECAYQLQDRFLIVMHCPLNLLKRRDKPGCFTALENKHLNPLRLCHVKKLLNASRETVLWEANDAALPANLRVITWKFHCKSSVLPPSKRASQCCWEALRMAGPPTSLITITLLNYHLSS